MAVTSGARTDQPTAVLHEHAAGGSWRAELSVLGVGGRPMLPGFERVASPSARRVPERQRIRPRRALGCPPAALASGFGRDGRPRVGNANGWFDRDRPSGLWCDHAWRIDTRPRLFGDGEPWDRCDPVYGRPEPAGRARLPTQGDDTVAAESAEGAGCGARLDAQMVSDQPSRRTRPEPTRAVGLRLQDEVLEHSPGHRPKPAAHVPAPDVDQHSPRSGQLRCRSGRGGQAAGGHNVCSMNRSSAARGIRF